MTVPKKPLTKNESAIQLGNILKGGPRGGGSKKSVIKKIKKLLKIGEKPTKNSNPIKEVKKAKKSLQNQKPDKSPKSSDWDAAVYKQPRKHGVKMGPRASRDLAKKHPEAAMNKRIPAGTIAQGKKSGVAKYVGKHAYKGKAASKYTTTVQSHPGLGGKMTPENTKPRNPPYRKI